MNKKTNSLAITILVAVIVGAAGFFGGMQYEKGKTNTAAAQFANGANGGPGAFRRFQNGQGGQGNRNGLNRPVSGEIVSQDANSITVKLQDGSTKIVNLTDKTTINKSSTAVKSDLKTGEQVTAFGAANSDGSINAQMVSLGQTMFFRGGPGGPNPSGAPSQK